MKKTRHLELYLLELIHMKLLHAAKIKKKATLNLVKAARMKKSSCILCRMCGKKLYQYSKATGRLRKNRSLKYSQT